MADADASPHRVVMIVLAYLWPLAVLPLLLERRDAEVQWHARHGLVLMIAEFVLISVYFLIVVYFSLVSALSQASLGLGVVLVLMLVGGWVGILALHVVAILKGVGGSRLVLPLVSRYADARRS
jgi:hypothetical protein